jgi:hypothetical protein
MMRKGLAIHGQVTGATGDGTAIPEWNIGDKFRAVKKKKPLRIAFSIGRDHVGISRFRHQEMPRWFFDKTILFMD